MADGSIRFFPMAKIQVRSRYFNGTLEVLVMEKMPHQLIIGNVEGSNANFAQEQPEEGQPMGAPQPETREGAPVPTMRDPSPTRETLFEEYVEANVAGAQEIEGLSQTTGPLEGVGAITRSATRRQAQEENQGALPKFCALEKTVAEVKALQEQDPTLAKLWAKVGTQPADSFETYQHAYIIKRGLLYRKCKTASGLITSEATQLVVPKILREKVLEVAHNSVLGCHMANRRTLARVETAFYWPGINSDVKRYCMSCDICQRTVAKGMVRRAPMLFSQLAERPFEHMYVDLIGEIVPPSARGHRYILTMIDGASRYQR